MGETLVTVVGNVATRPEIKTTSGGVPVARFRLATTERRWDRATDRWSDGHTNFFTVWAWRTLGENIMGSVGIGEPLVVQGRLRVHEREENGQSKTIAAIDAMAVGHDLNRGTAAFRRVVRARPDLVAPAKESDHQSAPGALTAPVAPSTPQAAAAPTPIHHDETVPEEFAPVTVPAQTPVVAASAADPFAADASAVDAPVPVAEFVPS